MATLNSLIKSPEATAATLGVLAGMRTFAAPVVASQILSAHRSKALNRTALMFMQRGTSANIFKLLSVGELVGDKLPKAPDRIKPPGVIGRAIAGALAGASVYKAAGRDGARGAIIGASAAVISTFGFYFLRKAAVRSTGLPDIYAGAIEDALVIGTGLVLIKSK